MANDKFQNAWIAWLEGNHTDPNQPEQLYQTFSESVQALFRAQENLEQAKKKLEEHQRATQKKDKEINQLEC